MIGLSKFFMRLDVLKKVQKIFFEKKNLGGGNIASKFRKEAFFKNLLQKWL